MLKQTEKLIQQFGKITLPIEDRNALTALMLSKVNALPLDNAIVLLPEGIQVGNRMLDKDQTISFKESCIVLNDNIAHRAIKDQLKYLAIVEGVHKALSPDQMLFSKAALWILEQEQILLGKIVTQGIGYSA